MKKLIILIIILFTVQFLVPIFGQSEQKPEMIVQLGHSGQITAIAYSPDKKYVLTGGYDNTIRLWERETGREIRTFFGHDGFIYELAWLDEGEYIASVSLDGTARLWDRTTGREIKKIAARETAFHLSGNGKIIIVTDGENTGVWQFPSGEFVRPLKQMPLGAAFAISPDGEFAFTGLMARQNATYPFQPIVVLWNVKTDQPVWWDENHKAKIRDVAFSPDGKFVATATGDINSEENAVRLFEAQTGRLLAKFDHKSPVMSVTISPGGKQVLSVEVDQRWHLWDAVSGKEIAKSTTNVSGWTSIKFSPDGKEIAIANNVEVKIYDVGKSEMRQRFGGLNYATTNAFYSPDGNSIITGNFFMATEKEYLAVSGEVSLWDLKTGGVSSRITKSIGGSVVSTSKDGKLILYEESHAVYLFDVVQNKEIRRFEDKQGEREDFLSQILMIAISPDNTKIIAGFGSIVGSGKNYAILWDAATAKELYRWETAGEVHSVGFTPDSQTIVVASGGDVLEKAETGMVIADREMKVFFRNALTGQEIKTLAGNRAVFSSDGKYILISGVEENSVRLFDAKNFTEIRTFRGHTGPIEALGFSQDNQFVLTFGGDNTVRVWETQSGKQTQSIPVASGVWNSVSLSQDNQFVLTLGGDGIIRIWRRETGEELCRLISFPDGTWLVITKDGRFDTNNLEKVSGIHWIIPAEPMRTLPIEVFMRDYYEPNLLPRLLKCSEESDCDKEFKPVRNLTELNRTQPKVRITDIKPTTSADVVQVTVEAEDVSSEFQKDKQNGALHSGVFDLRLFRDGQLVGYSTADEKLQATFQTYKDAGEELKVWQAANKVELVNGKKTFTFDVRLPKNRDAKEFNFTAYAFNSDRVKSETASQTFALPEKLPMAKGNAYLITIGVNANENRRYDLRYAANDARKLQEEIGKNLPKEKYRNIVQIPLISDYDKDGKLRENNAAKAKIKAVLDKLSGKTVAAEWLKDIPNKDLLAKVQPEDLVLIAFSGHGYADRNGIFYLIPSDIGKDASGGLTSVLPKSISSDELSLWLRDIDAGEMMMIVDACHSAAAVQGAGFKPGPMGSRGLGQVSYDKGMRILTATQADNVALELGNLQQGLLTYSLVKNGIELGLADNQPKDNKLLSNEWLGYSVKDVPNLYQEIKDGKRGVMVAGKTIPAGSNKGIEIILPPGQKSNLNLQQPSLFDFSRRDRQFEFLELPK